QAMTQELYVFDPNHRPTPERSRQPRSGDPRGFAQEKVLLTTNFAPRLADRDTVNSPRDNAASQASAHAQARRAVPVTPFPVPPEGERWQAHFRLPGTRSGPRSCMRRRPGRAARPPFPAAPEADRYRISAQRRLRQAPKSRSYLAERGWMPPRRHLPRAVCSAGMRPEPNRAWRLLRRAALPRLQCLDGDGAMRRVRRLECRGRRTRSARAPAALRAARSPLER